jgi:predicted phosphoribosyltransferase
MDRFRDRHDAGAKLAQALQAYADRTDVVVLALPRGGVPVGFELATRLGLPLDVLVVRKLGVPGDPELAMGAIASGGVQVVDRGIMLAMGVSDDDLDHVVKAERIELERREKLFRGDRPPLDVRGKTVVIIDDGIATGATMRAAVEGIRLRGPARVVVAVPVASPDTCAEFRALVDELICLATDRYIFAISMGYQEFSQTSDSEVRTLLDAAARALEGKRRAPASEPLPQPREQP